MKKKSLSTLLALLLLLSLTACGGASGGKNSGTASSNSSYDTAMPSAPAEGWNQDAMLWEEPETDAGMPDMPEQLSSALPANTKIILSADISLETTEFDAAEQAVSQLVTEAGGWFESRSVYQGGGYRYLRSTIRVPAQEFYTFLDLAGQAAHVTNRDEYAEDISEMYYDNESRLATQKIKLERLQRLLSEADIMQDIISLESAISETELEIEYLTGSLRKYDSLVGYSTVTLSLQEVYRLSGDEEPAVTFGQRLSSAFTLGFTRGVAGLEEFAVGLARNWFNLLILAVVVVLFVFLFRWWDRKHRRTYPNPPRPPKPPAPPEPPKSDGE